MNKNTIAKALLASSLLISSAVQAAVIDFEDFGGTNFVHGTVVNSQYSGLSISANNFGGGPNLAVAFDSTLNGTRDGDLESPFNSNNPLLADNFNPGNILIIQENGFGCGDGTCNAPDDEGDRPAGIISFAFQEAIELISLDFFDVETAEDGSTVNNRIRLFDDNNIEVFPNTFYTPDTGGNNLWDQVMFGSADNGLIGIARIDVYFGGSGALDNLVYNNLPPVPLPAAFWLFGTALVGFIGYSRRRNL